MSNRWLVSCVVAIGAVALGCESGGRMACAADGASSPEVDAGSPVEDDAGSPVEDDAGSAVEDDAGSPVEEDAGPADDAGPLQLALQGVAQKGPFVLGSSISIAELSDTLNPTGMQFGTSTTDELGHFGIDVVLATPQVEVAGDGYYFDEVAGALSDGTLTLRSISAVAPGKDLHVNVLTYLAHRRVRYLVQQGATLAEAVAQSQPEVLTAFNMNVAAPADFDTLDLAGTGVGDAMLVAVSAILQQTARARAGDGNVTAELSHLLALIAADLEEDGWLDDGAIRTELTAAAMALDPAAVRANLESYYGAHGQPVTVPPFEDYVDGDGDGLVPVVDDNVPDAFTFEPASEVDPGAAVESNEVTVSGILGVARAAASEATLIVNDVDVPTGATRVVVADRLRLRVTAPADFGQTTSATLTIGESTGTFTVSTFALTQYAFTLAPITNASSHSVPVFSNEIAITGLTVHYLPVSLMADAVAMAAIVKNGAELAETTTTVEDGDRVQIKLTPSRNYDVTVTADLTIGLTTERLSVTTHASPWTQLAPKPRQSFGETVAAVNGVMYAFGMIAPSGSHPCAALVDAYDVSSGLWSTRTPLIRASGCFNAYFGSGVLDGRVHVLFAGSPGWHGLYDPVADSWTEKAPPPNWGGPPIVGVIDGKLYVAVYVGGTAGGYKWTLDVYDPAGDGWTSRSSLFAPFIRATGLASGGSLLLFGGDDSVHAYDAAGDTWVTRTPHSGPDAWSALAIANGRVLLSTSGAPGMIAYDVAADRWYLDLRNDVSRDFVGAVVGGFAYVFPSEYSLETWRYDLALDY